jgi:hypothetical protein
MDEKQLWNLPPKGASHERFKENRISLRDTGKAVVMTGKRKIV